MCFTQFQNGFVEELLIVGGVFQKRLNFEYEFPLSFSVTFFLLLCVALDNVLFPCGLYPVSQGNNGTSSI